MSNLKELFLNYNEMKTIGKELLGNLENLHLLSLRGNYIVSIHEKAFTKLVNLRELNLYENRIVRLEPTVFSSFKLVSKLYIGNNPFKYIAKQVFTNMENLKSLNMEGIEIYNIDINMFQTLQNLESVYFKKYSYCSYAPNVPRCRPLSDGISSQNQLLYKPILRYSTWAICICTCVTNLMVLSGRYIFRDENKSLSLVIRNLAVSDFFMGLYLLMIAIHDVKYRDNYNTEAYNWIKSWGCTLTGMMGMISSEVSVLLLLFMSIDRFLLIAIPFGRYGSLSVKETTLVLILIWGFGISIAIIPTLEFYSSTRFYGVNGLCFPLFIDDPYFIGWEFSAIIFIGINAFSLIITAIVYVGMFVSIWKTRNATTIPIKDFDIAIRFFFIVLTDTICWLPIIITKACAYLGHEISADVYGWLIVFILPINSALNPILYTFTIPRYRAHLYRVPINAIESGINRAKRSPHGSADTGSMQLTHRNGPSIKIVTNNF
ncbi:unnamed protein product [Brassicogethes aeneus]|uniref:G-protein coupled receptors family 1 profile domain-containing protein n=1 Tax=Brassicogethes aeneus TaxID=1431903 RepID=A0A9P0BEK1_BRAAE|nr:unnamed protein product [Brassicogethes aeneus]